MSLNSLWGKKRGTSLKMSLTVFSFDINYFVYKKCALIMADKSNVIKRCCKMFLLKKSILNRHKTFENRIIFL